MKNIDSELVKKFMLDPEWHKFFDWFIGHFEKTADISEIDITLPATTVHAEVISRQNIDKVTKSMKKLVKDLREGEIAKQTKRKRLK